MEKRMEQLEHSILEMGTELYRLRHNLSEVLKRNDRLEEFFLSLKEILENKGIINYDDFDTVMLNKFLKENDSAGHDLLNEKLSGFKKSSH